jgi:hypothetical protein
VIARGFCIQPVPAPATNERIVVSSFDFAGQVTFSSTPTTPASAPAKTNSAANPPR